MILTQPKHAKQSLLLCVAIAFPMLLCQPSEAAPARRVAVWDTTTASSTPLTPTALSDPVTWQHIARGEKPESFQGDAVITGGPTIAVLRRDSAAIELYSTGTGTPAMRTRLTLLTTSGQPATRLTNVRLVENSRSVLTVEATYRTAQGDTLSAQVRVKRADVAVELRPGQNSGKIRVATTGRFAILPDFFADDIVLDARSITASAIDLPSENFLLLTSSSEDSLVMCTFENRDQEVKITLTGDGEHRTIASSEIGFGGGRKIWVALMDASRIWHEVDVDATKSTEPMRLDWDVPFPAQWRIDFTRKNKLSDSWEMLLPDQKGNGYLKPDWLGKGATHVLADRKRWTTVLGWIEYPCWIGHDRNAYIQPLKHRVITFLGPAIIYPINRLPQTPNDRFTVVDIVRNTLGVGPCEYILDVEGQKQEYRGRATCACRDALNAIYSRNKQKEEQQEIEQVLNDGLAFVTHIRGRITEYLSFARSLRKYLTEQKKLHPELTSFLDEMDQLAAQIETDYADKLGVIKTPDHVAAMNDDFRKTLLRADGPDTWKKVKQYAKALTRIGGNQDELVGQCRWAAKAIRQRAGIAMAIDPRCAQIAQHIREQCQKVMLKPASYEGARH